MNDTNIVYTKGFVNDDGCIEIPGVFLEDGAEVDLAIKTKRQDALRLRCSRLRK